MKCGDNCSSGMRELGDDVTFGERNDALPLLFPLVADLERGGGYGVEFMKRRTTEVVPKFVWRCIASVNRCFAHE